jgi:hypothetical protein
MAGAKKSGSRVRTVLATLAIGVLTGTSWAAGAESPGTSLQWVPDSAAFYGALFRGEDVGTAIANSRAWAALKEMPVVREALRYVLGATVVSDSGRIPFPNPQVQQVLALIGDLLSQEAFFYAEDDAVDFAALLTRLSTVSRHTRNIAKLMAKDDRAAQSRIQLSVTLAILSDHIDLLKSPTIVAGFKVRDPQRARAAIAQIESFLQQAEMAVPQLAGWTRHVTLDGHEYLTATVHGDMIPWDEFPEQAFEQLEVQRGDNKKIIQRIKTLTFTVALGLRGDYLLLATGPSIDVVRRLGQGTPLAQRPELKPLQKYADRRLLAVTYQSQSAAKQLAADDRDVRYLLDVAEKLLPKFGLDEDQEQRVRGDIGDLREGLQETTNVPVAHSAFWFLRDASVESYHHVWADHSEVDQRPLELLPHVGGRPMLALVSQNAVSLEEYDGLVAFLQLAQQYFEEYGLPQLDEKYQEQYEELTEVLGPAWERFDQTSRELLFPALGQAELALVFDGGLASRQYLRRFPATEEPLPMLEPALVLTIAKKALFRKALAEYRRAVNDGLQALHEFLPEHIPELKLAETRQTKTKHGTVSSWRLPEAWGVTEEIAPSVGLSDRVAMFTLTKKHAERLLTPTPLALGGVLADPQRPRISAVGIDWFRLVDVAAPWVELATHKVLEQGPRRGDAEDGTAPTARGQAILEQVQTTLAILKTFRTWTSESYIADNVLIEHSLFEFRDLEPSTPKRLKP